MFSYAHEKVAEAERVAASGDLNLTLKVLRDLPLDDFGDLLISLPRSDLPSITAILPRMAADQTQVNWTGSSGLTLLRQTDTFARLLVHYYERLSGKKIDESRVLDFGCGYGRILRALYYYTDPSNLFGCDPWDVSINICKSDGVLGQLAISDYLPTTLPFDGKFDLIYAFSVFTHLSERATARCLSTIADGLSHDGIAAITIRPVEYWIHDQRVTPAERESLATAHDQNGFAFSPHNREPIDGDVTYGDTSMTLAYLAGVEPRLRIRKFERTFDDPFQTIVFMSLA